MKIIDTMTGRLELVARHSDHFCSLNIFPSLGESVEVGLRQQGLIMGPDIAGGHVRPKWDGEVFVQSRNRPQRYIAEVQKASDLECDISEGAGAYVHLETTAEGGFSLVIGGFDPC